MEKYNPNNQQETENNNFSAHNKFFSKENLYKILGTTLTAASVTFSVSAAYELFADESMSQLASKYANEVPAILKKTLVTLGKMTPENRALLGVSLASLSGYLLSRNDKEEGSDE